MIENRYCLDLVRNHDRDRHLLCLLSSRMHRPALWALFAFNHEIAKTREVVSETATGLIRLQWWRDAIGKIYHGEILDHEVVKPLAEAIEKYDLPQELFESLIYVREFDVEDRVPGSLEGLKNYADFTTTPLNTLALQVLDEEDGGVQDVSAFYAVMGLVRAVPYHLHQKRLYMPEDVMGRYGSGLGALYDWKKYETLRPVVREVVEAVIETQKPTSKFLKAQWGLARLYADHIRKYEYVVFGEAQARPVLFKELRVWVSTF